MKLVFQLENNWAGEADSSRLYVSFDREGLEYLRSALDDRIFKKKHDAVKLFSDAIGPGDISSEPYVEGAPVVDLVEFLYTGE